MATIDGSAKEVMHLSSELCATRDVVVKRQRAMIWALVTVTRAERATNTELVNLVDSIRELIVPRRFRTGQPHRPEEVATTPWRRRQGVVIYPLDPAGPDRGPSPTS